MNESINPTVALISKQQARTLIERFHYLGKKGFRFEEGFGLFLGGGELIGAAVYHGPSAPETVVGAFGLGRTEQGGGMGAGAIGAFA